MRFRLAALLALLPACGGEQGVHVTIRFMGDRATFDSTPFDNLTIVATQGSTRAVACLYPETAGQNSLEVEFEDGPSVCADRSPLESINNDLVNLPAWAFSTPRAVNFNFDGSDVVSVVATARMGVQSQMVAEGAAAPDTDFPTITLSLQEAQGAGPIFGELELAAVDLPALMCGPPIPQRDCLWEDRNGDPSSSGGVTPALMPAPDVGCVTVPIAPRCVHPEHAGYMMAFTKFQNQSQSDDGPRLVMRLRAARCAEPTEGGLLAPSCRPTADCEMPQTEVRFHRADSSSSAVDPATTPDSLLNAVSLMALPPSQRPYEVHFQSERFAQQGGTVVFLYQEYLDDPRACSVGFQILETLL